MRRREFITLLGRRGGLADGGAGAAAGEAADHRLPGVRARLRSTATGSAPSCSGCANAAGSRAARSRSSIDGRRAAPSATPRSRPSSCGSRSMSSSQRAAVFRQSSRPHQRYLSCSRWQETRLAAASSRPGPRRQCYRPVAAADRCCQQAGGASARCCARSPAYGDFLCRQCQRGARAGELRQQPARSTLRWPRRKSGAARISCLRSRRSRVGRMASMSWPTRSYFPTGPASTPLPWPRGYRRSTTLVSTSKWEG